MASIKSSVNYIVIIPILVLLSTKTNSFHLTATVGNIHKTVNNFSAELLETSAVFLKENISLNCLGLPVNLFVNAIENLLVDKTEADDVKFYFASQKQSSYVTVRIKNFTLKYTDFNVFRDTIVLVHGFMSSGQVDWLTDMKDAFLKHRNVNVIVVDWQKGSNTWNYLSAASSTKIVGQEIATLFAYIRQIYFNANYTNTTAWGKIHLVGHSLGAHISARAAYVIEESQRNKTDRSQKWKVYRISGLDPAQPCFTTADLSLKLDKEDAEFIDVIHTNARLIIYLGLGLPQQLGSVDFYPNGGQIQPGCSKIDTKIWKFLLLPKQLIESSICSHGRAHAFFTESILNAITSNCSLIGHRWDRTYNEIDELLTRNCFDDICPEMGINSIYTYPYNEGTFFVPTGDVKPFCKVKESQKKIIKKQLKNDKSLENNFLSRYGRKIFGK